MMQAPRAFQNEANGESCLLFPSLLSIHAMSQPVSRIVSGAGNEVPAYCRLVGAAHTGTRSTHQGLEW